MEHRIEAHRMRILVKGPCKTPKTWPLTNIADFGLGEMDRRAAVMNNARSLIWKSLASINSASVAID